MKVPGAADSARPVVVLKADLRYLGKKELFRWPMAWFFLWCGGVPVDRSKPQGLVEQTVQAIQAADHFQVGITPEGTRGKVDRWKMGFYHIAALATTSTVAVPWLLWVGAIVWPCLFVVGTLCAVISWIDPRFP